jgi:hypothetical protein
MFRGDRGAVWFGFEYKSYSNREIKMHAVRLIFKKSSKPNQTNAIKVGSVYAVYRDIKNYDNITNLVQ